MDKYQRELLENSTAQIIHDKISDTHTQDVSAYDPDGIESLDTLVLFHFDCIRS